MSATKVFLGCRISPLARKLIDLEREQTGSKSDGDTVTILIYKGSKSPEAQRLMVEESLKNPHLAELIPVIRKAGKTAIERAIEGSSRAVRLSRQSGKKQKAESPSDNKSSREAAG